MPLDTARDVFLHQLGTVYDAEQQMVGMIDQVEMEALSIDLRNRMRAHRESTLRQIANLERCFELTGTAPPHVQSATVRGIREDRAVFTAAQPSAAALEIFNVQSTDRLAHYLASAYEAAAQLAGLIGLDDLRRVLEQNHSAQTELCAWLAANRARLLTDAIAAPRGRPEPLRAEAPPAAAAPAAILA